MLEGVVIRNTCQSQIISRSQVFKNRAISGAFKFYIHVSCFFQPSSFRTDTAMKAYEETKDSNEREKAPSPGPEYPKEVGT